MKKTNPHADFQFDKASTALKKLLYQIADIKIKRSKGPFVYKGPDILSSSVLVIDNNISDTFTVDNIEYHRERQRNKIDLFILKVFQLGYSVGTEMEAEKHKDWNEIFENLNNEKS